MSGFAEDIRHISIADFRQKPAQLSDNPGARLSGRGWPCQHRTQTMHIVRAWESFTEEGVRNTYDP